MKAEFVSHFKPCRDYAKRGYSCAPFCDVEVDGIIYSHVDKKTKTYNIKNPTPAQFEWIKKWIIARRTYIENAAVEAYRRGRTKNQSKTSCPFSTLSQN
jgi:hypothetical protein